MAAFPNVQNWQQSREGHCPSCQRGNAVTTMLPTKVPFFNELIVTNLTCEDCHFRSSETNFGGEIQERGERWTLQVTSPQDLNRQIIKSDSARLQLLIPLEEEEALPSSPQAAAALAALDLEIPPQTQRGTLSTLEGMIRKATDNLQKLQPERLKLGDLDNFYRCENAIDRLLRIIMATRSEEYITDGDNEEPAPFFVPFTVILDDPAGNSFIENPLAPQSDPNLRSISYDRTHHQNMALGLQPSPEAVQDGNIDDLSLQHKNIVNREPVATVGRHTIKIEIHGNSSSNNKNNLLLGGRLEKEDIFQFLSTPCPNCRSVDAETNMCTLGNNIIPHFQQVILMCLNCNACGYRNREIKCGGDIPRCGTRITLKVAGPEDLEREVLKSDTAGVILPELEMELLEGDGLDGGFYTTAEGLLKRMRERLELANPFGMGDSAVQQHWDNDGGPFSEPSPKHARYHALLDNLRDMAEGRCFPFNVVLSDPLSRSFVGPAPQDAVALSLMQAHQQQDGGNLHLCHDDDNNNNSNDPGLKIELYERTYDQNEALGLNDIKTEGYQRDIIDSIAVSRPRTNVSDQLQSELNSV